MYSSTCPQYLELLEEFKEVHKATDKLKSNQYTAADIKKDIQQMEQENEQLTKTIERKKARVFNVYLLLELLIGRFCIQTVVKYTVRKSMTYTVLVRINV